MNLKQFLDAAYVLILDEYQRIGVDLLTAISHVSEWASGGGETETVSVAARQNEQSMTMLSAMMSGVKGAPV